ncbi:Ca2+-binding RTX toxin-like protein [Microvirga lupini]|uniref:Ca2+-binding RTX toxin-like protein n=1 Tax=Microvirga lupini TaxID=420324 RepID=A0A7W4YYQ6_9HYPH|nr:calcium-binding protein [Microvirga lupini]MBB3021710.1 Ca2+-binding RTX toxin-like protein [Microvirga lupini]
MATVRLTPVLIGRVNNTDIYRVDLSQSGLSSIGTITIKDDNVISGSPGTYSGMDLDFVKIMNTFVADGATVPSTSVENVFDFSSSGVLFQPGFQTPLGPNDPLRWNTNLQGTSGANIYDPSKAPLDHLDDSWLSLGEGGQVTFLLKTPVSTVGRYLYFGEASVSDLSNYVLVSDVPPTTPSEPKDFTLFGTPGNDTIRLGTGANAHLQFANSTVYGRGGNDSIHGAFGNDTLYGEAGEDSLWGHSGNDWIHGGTKNDKVNGGSGNDTINGGLGCDRLSGAAGSDVFVFDSKLGTSTTDRKVNFDRITDFNVKYDSLWLDNAVFKKLGSGNLSDPKQLNKKFFTVSDVANDRNDYLVYNKKTGVLSYDADGSGLKAAVEFAQLKKGLSLTYKDFFII